MKTIVHIELSDQQLNQIHNWLNRKQTRQLAKRDDIRTLCQDSINGILACLSQPQPPAVPRDNGRRLDSVDPEDQHRLADKPRGFVIGWNKVKYNQTSRA